MFGFLRLNYLVVPYFSCRAAPGILASLTAQFLKRNVASRIMNMGSLCDDKDARKKTPKPGHYVCKECGAISKKKGKLCKPKEIKKD